MNAKPRNTILYGKVKSDADVKFLSKTSAYKSAWIVREYKKRGGRFEDPTKPDSQDSQDNSHKAPIQPKVSL